MGKSDIIKYQIPNEIIKYINKKQDIYNILFVCRAWYKYGIKVLYRDFSYEYTLLKIPTTTQLEWVRHYHTWIDAAEEKRNFQLYTLIQGMKRLESIHIDIFGHIKYFKKYRKFLYKFAELKKDQIKQLHISLDILDDNISDDNLIKFKTIFTQFIKIFKTLDVLILETGEENPFVDIQRLMIQCLTNVYDNNNNNSDDLILHNNNNNNNNNPVIAANPNEEEGLENESNPDDESEEELEDESDDEGTIISETELSKDNNEDNNRHMLTKLIIYDNNSMNIEESLSDIISKVPLRQLTIRSYLPKNPPEPISSISRCSEPFWRINRYKKEILSKYPEYFTSLALENQNSILNGNQFTDYESFCNRSKDKIWRKLYYVYYENLKKRVERENSSRSHNSSSSGDGASDSEDAYPLLSSSYDHDGECSPSQCTSLIHSTLLNNITTTPTTTTSTTSSSNIFSINSNQESQDGQENDQLNYQMESIILENCQSISVKLFSIIVSKLSHLSTIILDNVSFLPEFCVLKLLIGSGKNLLHLELNMASHQLTPDIIVCIATENSNLNVLCLKSSDKSLTIDTETINWMLTLCHQLYFFRIENADDHVHSFYKKNYNFDNSSFHTYKKTILNKTVINKIQRDTLINYEKLMNNIQ